MYYSDAFTPIKHIFESLLPGYYKIWKKIAIRCQQPPIWAVTDPRTPARVPVRQLPFMGLSADRRGAK